jgi:hypothetical protein
MPIYTSPFTGDVVQPTDVSYLPLSFSSDTQLYWPAVVNPTQTPAARIIDAVASANGLTVLLPDATQGALGSDILFRNLGAYSFIVTDAAGGQSVTVPVGISKYFYLTDDTSVGGTWANLTFAAGTSYADAATLQGAGLTTISGKLATTQNVANISVNPVLNDASRATTFVWQSGNGVFNLPSAASLSTGWYIGFRNNGSGQIVVNPQTPSTINNQISITLYPGDSGYIVYDVSSNNFITVGLASQSTVTFNAATYDVDSIVGNTLDLSAFAPIIQNYVAQSGTRTASLDVVLPSITQLYVLVNNTNQPGYSLNFNIVGSLLPPFVLNSGGVAVILTDGTNIFLLTQGSAGIFYAVNGSAAAPSFSFNNDTATGMYLAGVGQLGLSANGTELIDIDNTNILQPLVTVNARLRAQLIDGGTF